MIRVRPCGAGLLQGYHCEENISALQQKEKTNARFQGPHEDKGRAQNHQQQEAKRPKATQCKRLNPRPVMKNLGFPRSRRLARQSDFKRLYKSGHRHSNRFLTVYASPVQGRRGKVGIVASKKLGNAVERNRIRRILRETLRTNQDRISDRMDLVIIVRRPALDLPHGELAERLLHMLRKSDALHV